MGKRRQIERRAKTQREAKQKVKDAIEKLKKDGIDERVSATIPFEKVAEKWLEVYAATGVKDGSVRVRKKEINIMKKYFGKSPIDEITHSLYQNMLLSLSKDRNKGEPYADTTISGVNTCANVILSMQSETN